MMWRLLLVILLATAEESFSQEIIVSPQQLPPFRSLRFDEDYSFLRDDTTDGWYKRIKFSELSRNKTAYVSYGGDIRFQYFYVNNEQWGDAPKDKDGYILSRLLVHADLHTGSGFRTFVQLQSSIAGSRIDPGVVDENPLDIHQAFVDFKPQLTPSAALTFRGGRQELSYGSQRLIGVREGPNSRQSFDAVKVLYKSDRFSTDIFYGHYVSAKRKTFDDISNRNTRLWGVYFVNNRLPVFHNIDIYYLGLFKAYAVFDHGVGKETRHSVGARIWNDVNDWNYDVEGLYQFGRFAGKPIAAWTASVNTSYTISDVKWKPVVGLKAELISGDRSSGDSKLQTFNPLFPRGAYFGLAALIGPANLVDFHPYFALQLNKAITFGVDYDVFWRYSIHDGLYVANGALIYSGMQHATRYIGDQFAFNIEISPNNFFQVTGEFTWFDAGGFLKAASPGKDILFTGLTMQFKF